MRNFDYFVRFHDGKIVNMGERVDAVDAVWRAWPINRGVGVSKVWRAVRTDATSRLIEERA